MKYIQQVKKFGLFSSSETFKFCKRDRVWRGDKGTIALHLSSLRFDPNNKGITLSRIPASGM